MENTELLEYFNKELISIKQHRKNFADVFPEHASHLNSENINDPLVSHLIESFAFLTARVQHNIENGHRFIIEDILNLMYPHYLLPLPSAGVMQLKPKNNLSNKAVIQKDTEFNNHNFIFSAGYHTEVYPLDISRISYTKELLLLPRTATAKSCLKIQINSFNPKTTLDQLNISNLRFYINSNNTITQLLYQQLFSNISYIGLSCEKISNTIIEIAKDNIHPCGFSDSQMLLPASNNSLPGYCLMSEYFAYPEKFNFFDLKNINTVINSRFDNSATIYIYFTEHFDELEHEINKNSLKINCIPIVNLFKKTAEPIKITQSETEFQVIPDQYIDPKELAVYTIKDIQISSEHPQENLDCEPFFARKYHSSENVLYWHSKRKSCWELGMFDTPGDELLVSFSSESINQSILDTLVVTPNIVGMNREVKKLIKQENFQHNFMPTNNQLEIDSCKIIKPLTATKYRQFDKNIYDLISHITQGNIALNNSDTLLDNIKALIKIYSLNKNHSKKIIDSLISAKIYKTIKRHPSQIKTGFIQGHNVVLTIKEETFPNQNAYLFGKVLSVFMREISQINCFIDLEINTEYQTGKYQWSM